LNEFVTTNDGTITLVDKETGELFHNRAGAYTEAFAHYVQPSQAIETLKRQKQVRVLDVCFGLGYNSLVLMQTAVEAGAKGMIEIVGVESDETVIATTRDVLHSQKFNELCQFFGCDNFATQFRQISRTFNGLQISIELRNGDARAEIPKLHRPFDLVFHDPFSPRKVPELWTVDLFAEYHRLLKGQKGSLLTYSARGSVRAGLLEAGFQVYKTGAVGEKAGGTLASVDKIEQLPSELQHLSDDDLSKLEGVTGVPYRDAYFSLSREDIVRARELEQAT
jgi:tRNA U34 5-methylaminomethyl-2-thiouridine-forming methyltransferase MnmC